MRYWTFIILFITLTLSSCSSVRLGTSVYYKLDDSSPIELNRKSKQGFDKAIENRFFDVLSKEKSLQIRINDSIYFFNQKNREEPKEYKKMIAYCFYRRKLSSDHTTIKYLKLLEINDSSIVAEATFKNKIFISRRKKEKIVLKRKELKGIFLGRGKNTRLFLWVLPIAVESIYIIKSKLEN